MTLPSISAIGRLTGDVELRFASSGTAVATIPLAFNARRKNQQTGEWEDGDVCYLRGTAFKQLAENAAETLRKGTEVVVTGRIKTEQWEDKNGGGKRSATVLMVDTIGPSLAYATATVSKSGSSAPAQQGGARNDFDAAPF